MTADYTRPYSGKFDSPKSIVDDLDQNSITISQKVDSIFNSLVVDKNANMNLNGVNNGPVVTMQDNTNAVELGTILTTDNLGVAVLAIAGTFVGTIAFEGRGPDNNWYPLNVLQRGTGAIGSTTSIPGLFEVNVRGINAVRANITKYTSGNITVKGQAQALSTGGEFVQLAGTGVRPDGSQTVQLVGSDASIPTDIQGHLQTMIQTHNAVSVAAAGTSIGAWFDTDGFNEIALLVKNDANLTSFSLEIQWSPDNGVTILGDSIPTLFSPGSSPYKQGLQGTLCRYARVIIANSDTAAHTMSAWVYLKA
jgi:hypothetical protein